jgi:hypothetical protein
LPGDSIDASADPENHSTLDLSFGRQGEELDGLMGDAPSLSYDGHRKPDVEADSFIEENINPLLDLTGQIIREHLYPSAFGGFADVWTGMWNKKSGSFKVRTLIFFILQAFWFRTSRYQVAIKVLRSIMESPENKSKIDKVNLVAYLSVSPT